MSGMLPLEHGKVATSPLINTQQDRALCYRLSMVKLQPSRLQRIPISASACYRLSMVKLQQVDGAGGL